MFSPNNKNPSIWKLPKEPQRYIPEFKAVQPTLRVLSCKGCSEIFTRVRCALRKRTSKGGNDDLKKKRKKKKQDNSGGKVNLDTPSPVCHVCWRETVNF